MGFVGHAAERPQQPDCGCSVASLAAGLRVFLDGPAEYRNNSGITADSHRRPGTAACSLRQRAAIGGGAARLSQGCHCATPLRLGLAEAQFGRACGTRPLVMMESRAADRVGPPEANHGGRLRTPNTPGQPPVGSIFIRQYARRLEVVSPGGFPPGITSENIADQPPPAIGV
jgi:hypothetical protein